jgi:hypothetical protein
MLSIEGPIVSFSRRVYVAPAQACGSRHGNRKCKDKSLSHPPLDGSRSKARFSCNMLLRQRMREIVSASSANRPRTRGVVFARDVGRPWFYWRALRDSNPCYKRRAAWRTADAITGYWCVLLRFHGAVEHAKKHGLKEAAAYVEMSEETRWSILDRYRAALNRQLLTPAPDVASVNWKRRELKSYGIKKELVEKATADDIAFLDAHPTRNSRANKSG